MAAPASSQQAERAGVQDGSPAGPRPARRGSVHDSHPPEAARNTLCVRLAENSEKNEMSQEVIRSREAIRRKTLWKLASVRDRDPRHPSHPL